MQSVQFSLMAATLKLSMSVKSDTLQWCDKENWIKEKYTFLITQTLQWRQVIVSVGLCIVSWVFLFKSALAQPRAVTPFAEKKKDKPWASSATSNFNSEKWGKKYKVS